MELERLCSAAAFTNLNRRQNQVQMGSYALPEIYSIRTQPLVYTRLAENTRLIRRRHNLPPDIEALFTKTPAIKEVIELAISDKETYCISYRDHDGQVLCKHYNLPNPLTEWLYASHPAIIRDLNTLSVALGPYESYYAWDKTSSSWSNLPPSLEKAVLARLESQDAWKTIWKANGAEAPCFVSLGAEGAYFMRTITGGGCWDLKCGKKGDGREGTDGIRGSNKFLEDCADFNGVAVSMLVLKLISCQMTILTTQQGVHLFPSHPNSYILILTSGKAFSNLPECTWPDYNKIAPALPTFVQGSLPIPPTPQQRSAQPQTQPQMQPQMQSQMMMQPHPNMSMQQPMMPMQPPYQPQYTTPAFNCCPQHVPGAPHNCCPQTPMQPRMYGMPSTYGTQFGPPLGPQFYPRY